MVYQCLVPPLVQRWSMLKNRFSPVLATWLLGDTCWSILRDSIGHVNHHSWLVVWNIFHFPIYWVSNHPNWRSYFSGGVAQPPTRQLCTCPPTVLVISHSSLQEVAFFKFSLWLWLGTVKTDTCHDLLRRMDASLQSLLLQNCSGDSQWISQYGGFLSPGGTPSHHPFLDGIFPYNPSSYGGTPIVIETPICFEQDHVNG